MSNKTIVLIEEESALVIHRDCTVKVYIPGLHEKENEDKEVPDNALLVSILGVLLNTGDREFTEFLDRKIEEYFGFIEKEADSSE